MSAVDGPPAAVIDLLTRRPLPGLRSPEREQWAPSAEPWEPRRDRSGRLEIGGTEAGCCIKERQVARAKALRELLHAMLFEEEGSTATVAWLCELLERSEAEAGGAGPWAAELLAALPPSAGEVLASALRDLLAHVLLRPEHLDLHRGIERREAAVRIERELYAARRAGMEPSPVLWAALRKAYQRIPLWRLENRAKKNGKRWDRISAVARQVWLERAAREG